MMNEKKNTKIILLESENVKILKAIRIEPNGNMIEIAGNNAQGKSTVLDCIEYALGGKAALPAQPLRRGAEKGYIVLETENLIIKRTFTKAGGGTLTVKDKKTGLILEGGPQDILDRLTGELTFDPLAITRMDTTKLRRTLAKMCGVDLDAVDAQRKALKDKRTEIGREVKRLKGSLDSMTCDESMADAVKIDAADLMEQLNGVRTAHQEMNAYNETMAMLTTQHAELMQQLNALNAKIEKHTEGAEGVTENMERHECFNSLQLEAQIATASTHNAQLEANSQYRNTEEELFHTDESYKEKTAEIKTLDKNTAESIANAKSSVAGLVITEDDVLYNDVPFDQASQAEKIKVGVCMGRALNPKLNIVLIRDGSLLDDASMALLGGIAEMEELQVWIERVGKGGEAAIVIENGEIKGE